jgi:hypothetical protein
MSGLGALWYADRCALLNDLRRVLRSPGRITVWIVYALSVAGLVFGRLILSRFGAPARAADIARADYFACALMATLALSLALGFGAIGIFRSRAEARFIIGSRIAAPLAIAYLQARESLARGRRLIFSFVYFILVFGPQRIGLLTVLADVVLIFAVVCAAAAIVVPRRLLARPAGIACMVAGLPLALLALAPALRDAVERSVLPLPPLASARILALLPAWHPGRLLLEAQPLALIAVVCVAAAAILLLASAGRDAYPELYALSMARIDRLERWRQRRSGPRAGAAPRAPAAAVAPAPRGSWIFVWKSVVEFRRRTPLPYVVGGAALWCVAGFAGARFIAASDGELFGALLALLVNVMLIAGIGAANGIAAEIRRPLFWLSATPLFERFCALALASIWRTVATLELIAAGYAAGGGSVLDTLLLGAGLPVLAALLAATGFAAFALFPSDADWRGPVAALRLLASLALLAPPAVLYALGATLGGAPLVGLGASSLLALIEAGALIGIAAWRLDGRVDRLA